MWEITGWLLLVIGLFVFFVCFVMLVGLGDQPRILEPAALIVIGIFIFRGGIQLLKIAAAAAVCRSMSDRLLQPGAGMETRSRGRKTGFERAV
jgi:hypothetical protein